MPKLTINLSEDAAKKATEAASRAHVSVSQWIDSQILDSAGRSSSERDELGYPKGWFEDPAGSLADLDDFVRPADPPPPPIAPLNL